jgi:hypothetical protein
MERAMVVYESMFGNTRTIAEAVGVGLSGRFLTDVVEVGVAPGIPETVGLLVVGGPTHAFGLTRSGTREDAAKQADGRLVSSGIGLREWLLAVQGVRPGLLVATFDTRIDRPRVPGSAARGAEKRLRRMGAHVVVRAESFYVSGTKGPLVGGEAERARRWAEHVSRQATTIAESRSAPDVDAGAA